MNLWAKNDVNVLIVCRLSGDNRQDIVRQEVAEEGFCVTIYEAREMSGGGWLTKENDVINKRGSFMNIYLLKMCPHPLGYLIELELVS